MRFISVGGFTVRQDKLRAFQEWVTANEASLAALYPEGTRFIGIFAAVQSSEKEAGTTFWLDELDSYGAQDRLAALGKDNAEYAQLIDQFLTFIDPDPKAFWSSILLKDVVDTTVFDMPSMEAREGVRA